MTTAPRRILGALLLLFSFAPLYRLLEAEDDALRQASVEVATSAGFPAGSLNALATEMT